MDTTEIVITAAVGLVASIITAYVTYTLNRRQERRRQEREVAAKLADIPSARFDQTMIFAVQHAQACLIVEREGVPDRDRVFLPLGCRVTIGRDPHNHIVVNDQSVSRIHASFRASDTETLLEPLGGTNALALNGQLILKPAKLRHGDVVTLPDAGVSITVVAMSR